MITDVVPSPTSSSYYSIQQCQTNRISLMVRHVRYLCPRELDHAFGCRMGDLNLSQDSMAVVGEHNTTHGIQQHLQHSLRAQTRTDNIGDSLCGGNVGELCLAAYLMIVRELLAINDGRDRGGEGLNTCLTLPRIGVHHQHWCLHLERLELSVDGIPDM